MVLPEATYLERDDDVAAPAYKQPFLAVRQEAVPPLDDSKPGWWIAKELAGRVGLAELLPVEGRARVRGRAASRGRSRRRPGARDRRRARRRRSPTCEEEGLRRRDPDRVGKIELRSEELARLGFDPLPQYYPPDEPPPGQFRLLTGRAPTHTFGRTVNNRLLAEPYPENEVWVNADAAAALPGFARPLEDGERVSCS